MTNHAPIDQPILEILNSYNPLEVKDILIVELDARLPTTRHGTTYLLTTKSTTHTYTTTCSTHLTHGTITQSCRRHTL